MFSIFILYPFYITFDGIFAVIFNAILIELWYPFKILNLLKFFLNKITMIVLLIMI